MVRAKLGRIMKGLSCVKVMFYVLIGFMNTSACLCQNSLNVGLCSSFYVIIFLLHINITLKTINKYRILANNMLPKYLGKL